MDHLKVVVTGAEPMPVKHSVHAHLPITVMGLSGAGRSRAAKDLLNKQILIMSGPECIRHLIEEIREHDYHIAVPAQEEESYHINPDCPTDHGERTNYKLKDQPFYQRGRNGKMRGY